MDNQKDAFDAFVKSQQVVTQAAPPVDWGEERERWLRDLNELHERIEQYLNKYSETGEIRFDYQPVEMDERDIGQYTALQLTIHIGRQEIKLVPVGTMLVGTRGRVDIVGRAGKSCFMLVGKGTSLGGVKVTVLSAYGKAPVAPEPPREIDWTWKIVETAPANRFVELTPESLFQVLIHVSGR
jgi:hypothetical protein